MKKFIYFAAALLGLASCTSDDYIGDQGLREANENGKPISFGTFSATSTRAFDDHATSAANLNNNFVLWGTKTVNSTEQTVFDNYQVNYVATPATTANSTESNSADWEYVSYNNLPYGTRASSSAELNNNGVAANATASGIEQSIKYWDFNASQYNFFAYSLGAGSSSTYATATALASSTYQLSGTAAQLGTCYISKKKTVTPSAAATQVQLEFVSMLAKIQLGFYETIPGYSVKSVTFYADGSTTTTAATPYLYGAANSLPTGGTYTITFDSDGNPVTALSSASSSAGNIQVGTASSLSGLVGKDYLEENPSTPPYLARTSNAASKSEQITVLPNPNGTALTLKMDYTLVSRDGSGETIEVKGANATIPANFTAWKPNYSYTYIFKLSDNTNGAINSITGLYPITLDAVTTSSVVAEQQTITTVHTPSITTYQKGAIGNEYAAGNIYIVVEVNGTAQTLSNSNAKLYTAEVQTGAAQGITEETVANALLNGADVSGSKVVTDANGKKLTVTPVASSPTVITSIPATDSPDGNVLTVAGAVFTASASTTYVFEYKDSSDKLHYKVIKVGA